MVEDVFYIRFIYTQEQGQLTNFVGYIFKIFIEENIWYVTRIGIWRNQGSKIQNQDQNSDRIKCPDPFSLFPRDFDLKILKDDFLKIKISEIHYLPSYYNFEPIFDFIISIQLKYYIPNLSNIPPTLNIIMSYMCPNMDFFYNYAKSKSNLFKNYGWVNKVSDDYNYEILDCDNVTHTEDFRHICFGATEEMWDLVTQVCLSN